MFIISLNYVKPLNDIDLLIEPHIAFLDKYYANNTFILSGRKIPRTGGIIIARCENQTKLEKILKEDPFYKANAVEHQIIEMQVTKSGDQFKALLEG